MTMTMKTKQTRKIIKAMKAYADPPTSFVVIHNTHIKVSWTMVNDQGKKVRIIQVLSSSPRSLDYHIISARNCLRRTFKQNNITQEVNF